MKLEQLPETNEIERREAAPTWQSWLEIAGLVGALLAVGGLIDAHDPFLVRREFSWFILAPLLAGLQYGASHGLLCGAAQALALAIAWKAGITSVPDSIAQVVLGWLAAGLLAGEFHDAWQRRIRRVEASSERLRTRLTSLGRAYLALKVSHDELEREGPGRPASLRDALASFQRALAGRSDSASLESLGDLILALFAEHAFVHVATLHPVDAKGQPGAAIATLGPASTGESDPLVHKAARQGVTTSVRDGTEGAQVLAAVPLVDFKCRVHAVVAIRDMPFVALHGETLELLATLGGRLGDFLSQALVQAPQAARAPRSELVAVAPASVESAS
ncbi:MAG: hypothetical protein E6J78_10225 [Deltaproteobacteria bacterium]|nr:MAG: hypothetical protein E6J78_10225 [Deltaproteobacteria bacterium]